MSDMGKKDGHMTGLQCPECGEYHENCKCLPPLDPHVEDKPLLDGGDPTCPACKEAGVLCQPCVDRILQPTIDADPYDPSPGFQLAQRVLPLLQIVERHDDVASGGGLFAHEIAGCIEDAKKILGKE